MAQKNKLTVIVGCGRLGSSLANKLSSENEDVVIVDRRAESFERLSSFGGLTIIGDGCDSDVLKQAHIEEADTLVATTNFDNNNILIGQAAKVLFNVPNIIIRLDQESKDLLVKDMGIHTVCPAELSSSSLIEIINLTRGDDNGKN